MQYDRVDRAGARELFIRHALVDGDWVAAPRVPGPQRARSSTGSAGWRPGCAGATCSTTRRCTSSTTSGSAADVTSARHFDRWWKQTPGAATRRCSTSPTTCSTATAGSAPPTTRTRGAQGDLVLPLSYRFDPGGPLDGVAVHVPLTALNQVTGEGFDWQIPGHRAELVGALVRTLPKDVRRGLIPMAETTPRPRSNGSVRRAGRARRCAGVGADARSSGSRVAGRRRSTRGRAGAPADERRRRRRRRRRCTTPTTTSTRSAPGWRRDGPGGDRRPAPIDERRGIVDVGRRHAAAGRRESPAAATPCAATRRCSTTTTACRCAC